MSSLNNDSGAPLAPPTTLRNESNRPYGVLSSTMKDHLYFMDTGAIFTTPWVMTEALVRRSATILLTTNRAPFEVHVGDAPKQYEAVAIKPLAVRGVRAMNVPLVSVQFGPLHPQFRLFRAIPDPGLLVLDRNAFAPFDSAFDAAYRGELAIEDAYTLFDNVVTTAVSYLPKGKPADPRVERTIELLRDNPQRALDELAANVGLSYGRMSQLFAETVGISLRSYQLYLKLLKAIRLLRSGRKLTEIAHAAGFTDLAHMSRIFQQSYGAPMSYFINDNNVMKIMKPAPATSDAPCAKASP
jgi:AraC family transcriptional regulator, arabinose operon regulatory protein